MATRADPLAAGAVGGRKGQFVLVEWSDPGGLTSRERPIAGLHVHHSDDEAWYVLEGTLGFRVGDDEVEAGAGAAVFVPRGTPHSFWNAGDGPARYVLVMPPRLKALVEALHAPGAGDFAAIFREHASELI
ncbi:MAG TPA: cupin domain-containing protein [Gaiellales bacterium]|jgi:mannose-6-phosphate isomerase-like protein (cupin superfamily)|nr:cupin domain-containing protein [Gaiellales bacterium]